MRRRVAEKTGRVGPYLLVANPSGRGYEVRFKGKVIGSVLPHNEPSGRQGWQIGEDKQHQPYVYRSLPTAARGVGQLFQWTVESRRRVKTGDIVAFLLRLRRP